MKMYIKSVMVEDQQKALEFYTETLGFKIKHNIPMGEHSWITLVSADEPDGVELALEPNQYPAARKLQDSLMEDGIPWTAFGVDDIHSEVQRLEEKGVSFTQPPMKAGDATMAVFDDTCGNLIQLIELHA
ncbi:VOC family protein [Erythrobacter sp. GH1-10]|uniref:VOC family protein n=1 Tax=Erythrobacter sp. GH1-10 TaxID=3349334 RepID=UPI003878397A